MSIKIRLETGVLAAQHQSGVARYTAQLQQALQQDGDIELRTWSFPAFAGKVYTKLQSYGFAPAFDAFSPKVDLTIFPNFATWPTIHSGKTATVIHDLTYLKFPQLVEQKNLAHLQRVVAHSAKKADYVITVSEFMKSEIVETFHIDPAKVIVTPIPPSDEFSQPSNVDVRAEYSIPTQHYLYFIGNLEPRKNLATLIRAYLQLPQETKDEYSLVIAGGTGWNNTEVDQLLTDAKQSNEHVIHIGKIPQQHSSALYQNASLFVMPSLYEGFGIPVLEAMASGTPVLCADIPVLHEVGAQAARYADPESPEAFADAIQAILQDKEETARMKSDGLQRVAQFDRTMNVQAMKDAAQSN